MSINRTRRTPKRNSEIQRQSWRLICWCSNEAWTRRPASETFSSLRRIKEIHQARPISTPTARTPKQHAIRRRRQCRIELRMVVRSRKNKETQIFKRAPQYSSPMALRKPRPERTYSSSGGKWQCYWNGEVVYWKEERLVGQVLALRDGLRDPGYGSYWAWKAARKVENVVKRWAAGTE